MPDFDGEFIRSMSTDAAVRGFHTVGEADQPVQVVAPSVLLARRVEVRVDDDGACRGRPIWRPSAARNVRWRVNPSSVIRHAGALGGVPRQVGWLSRRRRWPPVAKLGAVPARLTV